MNQPVFDNIARLLEEMHSLVNADPQIPAVEIELLKKKCASLYEHILQLHPGVASSGMVNDEAKLLIGQEPETAVSPEETNPVSLTGERPAEPAKEPRINLFDQEPKAPPDEISIHKKISSSLGNQHEMIENFQAKIDSLKSAISLNQKIAYVNVLFKENTVEYAKAIDKLNAATTFDEAMRYFNELKHIYNWENDHELVEDLHQLIEKRFS